MDSLNASKLEKFAFKFFQNKGLHSSFNAMTSAAINEFPDLAEKSREAAVLAYYDWKHKQYYTEYEQALQTHASEIKSVLSAQWATK